MGLSDALAKAVGGRVGRLSKAWQFDSKAVLLHAPLVVDLDNDGKESILIGTGKGELILLDDQAKERWRYAIQEPISAVEKMFLDQDVMNSINAPPVVADLNGDGRHEILFGSEMGVLYCLDRDGKLLWKFSTGAGIRGSPLVVDVNDDDKQEVIFGCTDKFLYILSDKGKLIERFEQESPIESTPAFKNGKLVFGTDDGTIVCISPDGKEFWQYKTGGKVTAAPVFGTLTERNIACIVVGSTDNKVYCIDVDGELVWTYETGGAVYNRVVIADLNGDGKHEVVVGSCDNNVHAITGDGERFWTYETDFWVVSSPMVKDIDGDGKVEVVIGSYDHNMYVLDAEGSYLLDYVPGLSGVVQQAGHYSDILTQEPGQHVGKRLWQFKADGLIVGCTPLGPQLVVVSTKNGVIDGIMHSK